MGYLSSRETFSWSRNCQMCDVITGGREIGEFFEQRVW